MKQQNLLRRVALFGAFVWLLCFLFAATAVAIDTPWVTLKPDSETTEEPAQTESPADRESGTSATEQSGEENAPASVVQPPANSAPTASDPAPEPTQKRGCGSTVAGTAMLLPALLSVLFIGPSVSPKRE